MEDFPTLSSQTFIYLKPERGTAPKLKRTVQGVIVNLRSYPPPLKRSLIVGYVGLGFIENKSLHIEMNDEKMLK